MNIFFHVILCHSHDLTQGLYIVVGDRVYAAGSNQDGQLGLGHCNNTTTFQMLPGFCDSAPVRMLSAGRHTSAALTGLNSSMRLGSEDPICARAALMSDVFLLVKLQNNRQGG